jgi:hypothetical protein
MNDIINDLIIYANNHKEGFSIRLKKGKITEIKPSNNKRYVYAITELIVIQNFYEKTEREIDNPKIVKIINQCYIIHPKLFNKQGNIKRDNIYLGGYYNEKENNYYIEFIQFHKNKIDALLNGAYLNQYSIYDLIDKKEIVINDSEIIS